MRIAYVTQWFEPEPNIIKGVRFVQALRAAGHEVTVITGFPNYPEGRIYPGYRLRPVAHDEISGVKVVRLALYPSHDRSTVRRSLNYLSFFVSALLYLTFRRRRFDLAYVYHPPITVGLAAALTGIPFVLDVQDLWPDTVVATRFRGASRLVTVLGGCCRFVYGRAVAIVTQSEGMRRVLIERGVPAEKITVIRNWAASESGGQTSGASEDGRFDLVYGGNFGLAQDLGNLIEAAAQVERARPDVRVALYGSGVAEAELRCAAAKRGLRNIEFAGRVTATEMAERFARADALLLHLGKDPLFDITIPSKTQQYLAAGRPIVAAVNGEAGEILRQSGAAIVVPPADPAALAGAIAQLADAPDARKAEMGQAGADHYAQHFAFARSMERTVALIEDTYAAVKGGQGRG